MRLLSKPHLPFRVADRNRDIKIPNACNLCHTDKTTGWATTALKGWTDRSPWRAQ